MSHQTGIKCNEELQKFFGKCREGHYRVLKVSIKNEQMVLDGWKPKSASWEKDFDLTVPKLISGAQPAFLLYRFDSLKGGTYEWLLISYIPEEAPVREKMIYASTKATLKKEFGSGQIKDELKATSKEDATFNGYQKHKKLVQSPAPLTSAEEELAELKLREKSSIADLVSIDSKHQTMSAVSFPIDQRACPALASFRDGRINYLQFSIVIDKEVIKLEEATAIGVHQLPGRVPDDKARYHLFKFPHSHEGDYLESNIFIYSMPGYNCSIKERMLYSSCKASVVSFIEKELKANVDKKIEIDSGSELTEEFLHDELHPTINLHQPKFEKPKGPPNRGARRIIKPN
ncbi:twinfilin-like [Artemia franciscana]|uniref:Twinfilin n=1 Tax=Artemia franciscana TaxID=6661 RepID=A0AA88KRJ0_ARTSF|nr:hypothetical protein QYM36_018419 [Artemia franciscana]KAK2703019.1 hypothetical protein QYM36_018419 [Artemia franciscana]